MHPQSRQFKIQWIGFTVKDPYEYDIIRLSIFVRIVVQKAYSYIQLFCKCVLLLQTYIATYKGRFRGGARGASAPPPGLQHPCPKFCQALAVTFFSELNNLCVMMEKGCMEARVVAKRLGDDPQCEQLQVETFFVCFFFALHLEKLEALPKNL